jgi:hypothetical protein
LTIAIASALKRIQSEGDINTMMKMARWPDWP